jgi:4-hydroxy-3-polyprenylbenzoate decarboxylase
MGSSALHRKIIVAVTGASGAIYALKLLERLRTLPEPPAETAVIFTGNASEIMLYETGAGFTPAGNERLWDNKDFNAPFASGSSSYDTMIICPASMGMVGRIAHGISDDLITRAADVMLKERRRLILVPRETPYSLIHITNMKLLTEAGAIICPATPSFYSRPQTIDELVMTVIDRVLSLAGFAIDTFRWNEGDDTKE